MTQRTHSIYPAQTISRVNMRELREPHEPGQSCFNPNVTAL